MPGATGRGVDAAALKTACRRHPLLVTAFVLASLAALFFAVRMTLSVVYWRLHEEEPIRPWMTVGYIGKSWGLDPRLIDEVAGLPPPAGRHPFTLTEIARRRGVPVEHVIADVEAAIAGIRRAGPEDPDRHRRGP